MTSSKIQKAHIKTPITLAEGTCLTEYHIAYETYGELNKQAGNAILICHGLTTDQHASKQNMDEDNPGWWQGMIGPGLAIDTDKFFVVSSNALGGFSGSTSPASLNSVTGKPYGMDFPVVTIADMVDAQFQLMDHLNIKSFHSVIGGCMGGFQVLEWLCRYPENVERAVLISTSPQVATYTQAMWSVMRAAIRSDPAWNKGDYYHLGPPAAGLELMAKVGALFWMSAEVMGDKFKPLPIKNGVPGYGFEPDFEIEAFFERIGKGASDKIDANSLMYLMRAMDYFDVARDYGSLEEALKNVKSKTLLVSYQSDWRYPASELERVNQALVKLGVNTSHQILTSDFGHGAFVYDTKTLAPLISSFLE